jgi:hypothetical protein
MRETNTKDSHVSFYFSLVKSFIYLEVMIQLTAYKSHSCS